MRHGSFHILFLKLLVRGLEGFVNVVIKYVPEQGVVMHVIGKFTSVAGEYI